MGLSKKISVSLVTLTIATSSFVIISFHKTPSNINILSNSIKEVLNNKKNENGKIEEKYYVDSNISDKLSNEIKNISKTTFEQYQGYIDDEIFVINIVSTSQNFEESFFNSNPDILREYNKTLENYVKQGLKYGMNGGYLYNNAVTFPVYKKGKVDYIVQLYRFPTVGDDGMGEVTTASHQSFHAIQYMLNPNLSEMHLPMWVMEGPAVLVGYVLYGRTEENVLAVIKDYHSPAENVKTKKYESISSIDGVGLSYERSMAAGSYLIGRYGMNKYIEFIKHSGSEDWRISFKKIFGVSVDTFYENVDGFVNWEMKFLGDAKGRQSGPILVGGNKDSKSLKTEPSKDDASLENDSPFPSR